MKNYLYIVLMIITLACNREGSKIVIKGTLENNTYSKIYLQELTVNGDGLTDSVELDKTGEFKIVKRIKYPTFYSLRVGNGEAITLVAMPKERISIEGKADSLAKTYNVEGSEESKRAQILNIMLNKTIFKLDSLNNVLQQFQDNPNILQIHQTLSMTYNRYVEEFHDFTVMFIKKDYGSFANIIALYQQINTNTFALYKEEDFQLYEKVDSALYKKYAKAPYVNALHANVVQMMEQKRIDKLKKLISSVGSQAPEIALPSPKGDTIKLSSLRGKYVLLDFWASWCRPCRDANPELVRLYSFFKSKGFEIFQVSLDKTKDAWVKAIRDDKLSWIHVSDLKFWDSPVAKLYNVESIPAGFLIDKDGTIIARNLSGESLEKRLEELMMK